MSRAGGIFLSLTGLLGTIWLLSFFAPNGPWFIERPRVAAVLKETQPARASFVHLDCKSGQRSGNLVPVSPTTEPAIESGQQPEAISLTHHVQHLEHLVSESLYGKVFVNDWMDTIAEFVAFPLSPVPVENWRDESEEAFQFLIGEKNLEAYLTIDKEDPKRISFRIEDSSAKFILGTYRRSAELCAYFGRGDAGELQDYSLQSYAKLSLGENRRNGIEAYKGLFSEGAIYQYSYETNKAHCFRNGIQDGRPIKIEGNCEGDLAIDLERVRLLNERVTQLLGEIGR